MGRSGEARAGSRNAIVIVAAGAGALVGVALLVVGVLAFGQASDARDRASALRRERAALVDRTRVAGGKADAPIGRAEKVATSVSAIIEASDALLSTSEATGSILERAVQLANDGDIAASRRLYDGEGATSVRRLDDELARARAALATAQQAVTALTAPAP